MRIFDRKPVLRWLTPLAFVLVVGGAGGVVAATANADPRLATRSAAELLVDVQKAQVDAMSGTVVQRSELGLPEIPGGRGSGDASLTSLISGTHTLKVWYAGPDKARLAVMGDLNESDVIKNGSDLWTWSFKDKTATHRTMSAEEAKKPSPPPANLPKTPQEAAEQVLKAVDPTTEVRTDGTEKVAGRPVYELVLEPKDARSKITQVRIAVDGTEHVPLRVQVFATADKPAFEVEFTSVDFARPDDAQFKFNPPEGTKVTEVAPQADSKARAQGKTTDKSKRTPDKAKAADQPKIVGKGWTSVVVSKMSANADEKASAELGPMLRSLKEVSGTWGSGRLFDGPAFSVLITNDGRIAAGAVQPDLLYEALGK